MYGGDIRLILVYYVLRLFYGLCGFWFSLYVINGCLLLLGMLVMYGRYLGWILFNLFMLGMVVLFRFVIYFVMILLYFYLVYFRMMFLVGMLIGMFFFGMSLMFMRMFLYLVGRYFMVFGYNFVVVVVVVVVMMYGGCLLIGYLFVNFVVMMVVCFFYMFY